MLSEKPIREEDLLAYADGELDDPILCQYIADSPIYQKKADDLQREKANMYNLFASLPSMPDQTALLMKRINQQIAPVINIPQDISRLYLVLISFIAFGFLELVQVISFPANWYQIPGAVIDYLGKVFSFVDFVLFLQTLSRKFMLYNLPSLFFSGILLLACLLALYTYFIKRRNHYAKTSF